MTTTITAGETVITPTLVLGWETESESRNIIHDILGSPNPDITHRPAGLRAGTLRLLFAEEEDAAEAFTLHRTVTLFQLVSTDRDELDMDYVTNGRIRVLLDDETRDMWVVEVDYREVSS